MGVRRRLDPPDKGRVISRARVLLLCCALAGPASAGAVVLSPGDLLVVTRTPGAVLRVDAQSGVKTVVSIGGLLQLPTAIALEADGRLLVADALSPSLLRIDPNTGVQSEVSSGGQLAYPVGIAPESVGAAIVANVLPFSFVSEVLRVALPGGGQSVVTSYSLPSRLGGVAREASGQLLFTDESLGALVRVDPVSGASTTLASDGLLLGPLGLAVDESGSVVIANGSGSVVRVDPETGDQTLISSGGNLAQPFGVVVEANGRVVVSDKANRRLVRIVPATGAQTVLASFAAEPFGLAVVPGVAAHGIPLLPTAGLLGFAVMLLAVCLFVRGRSRVSS